MKKAVALVGGWMMLVLSITAMRAQQIDLENIGNTFKKKPLNITGGVSLNTVFYGGNQYYASDPWNYFLTGNITFSLYEQINLPFAFSLTNSGANMTYPTMPNRFSIHPSYKWITGHFGDVSMTFSPYTLNGHQFTGGGVDLAPGNWKISAMVGRLQRKVTYNSEDPAVLPAYQRMGYGLKLRYEKTHYRVGVIGFYAKDNDEVETHILDSLQIFPQRNFVWGVEAGVNIFTDLQWTVEYTHSIFTNDLRAPESGSAWMNRLWDTRASTQNYNAFKTGLMYRLWENVIGIVYERIDPGYTTLGAYYFANDYENITVNYARPFLADKLNLSVSAGWQHDDLKNYKESATNRWVGSLALSYSPAENLNANLMYSNFQTYMNVKSPFDYINQTTSMENLDTLGFSQLSQNASLMVVLSFGQKEKDAKKHQVAVNLNFQETVDQHGDIIYTGGISRFYTLAATYGVQFPQQGMQLTSSFNLSYNDMGVDNSLTSGPSLGVNGRFLEKKLIVTFSTSYNMSFMQNVLQQQVVNIRTNIGYTFWKKHNVMISGIHQYRAYQNRENTNGVTATIAYAYNF